MVRFARVGLAAVTMCYPSVIRSRRLMEHDEGNTLKSQDNHEGLRALPLNSVECGNSQHGLASLFPLLAAGVRRSEDLGHKVAGPLQAPRRRLPYGRLHPEGFFFQ